MKYLDIEPLDSNLHKKLRAVYKSYIIDNKSYSSLSALKLIENVTGGTRVTDLGHFHIIVGSKNGR